MTDQLNVFGEILEECSCNPMTGFTRSGCCDYFVDDAGSHTVCVQMTQSFLEFSRFRGNDLSTPVPEFGFPGLKPGDRWCLCAARWGDAFAHDMAPRVILKATNIRALEVVLMNDLKAKSLDLS